MLTHTISGMEVAWTVGCLPGLFYNSRLFSRAAGDLAVLKIKRINSIREFSAITSVVLYAYLATIQYAFFLVGALAMTVPNDTGASAVQYAAGAVFLFISYLSSTTGYVVDKRRRHLREMIAAMEDEDDPVKLKAVIHGRKEG